MQPPRNTCVIGASPPGSNKTDLNGMSLPGWLTSIRTMLPVRAIHRSLTSTYSRYADLGGLNALRLPKNFGTRGGRFIHETSRRTAAADYRHVALSTHPSLTAILWAY